MAAKIKKAYDVAYTEGIYSIDYDSPLLLALNMMTSRRGVYRLTVVDSARRVKGIISGLRVLDFLIERRGVGIKRRIRGDLEKFLREPVHIFMSEQVHKLPFGMPLKGLISYMSENAVGHVVLVDPMGCLKGVITERAVLRKIPLRDLGIKVSDIMTEKVFTIEAREKIFEAAKLMSYNRVRRLPVLKRGKLSGIITVTDILRHLISAEYHIEAILSKNDILRYLTDPVEAVSSPEVETLKPDDDVRELLSRLRRQRPSGFPIIDSTGELIGIVSARDALIKLPKRTGLEEFVGLLSETSQTA